MTLGHGPRNSGCSDPTTRRCVGVRLVDGLAGLLSAGLLVIGIVLLLAAMFAPAVLSAAGLGDAAGPNWVSVLAHLGFGTAGELVVLLRGRWPVPVRAGADLVVIVVIVGVIWLTWWP